MKKFLPVVISILFFEFVCMGMYAQYTQTLPLNYEDFFRAEAIAEGGDSLEHDEYEEGATQYSSTSGTGVRIKSDMWCLSGKGNADPSKSLRNRSNPSLEDNSLSWGNYVDNNKGKAIIYDGTIENTRASIYGLQSGNTYSSADGSKVYYLAALINFSKVSSGGADFLSFDGNYTATTQRARIAVKKGSSSNNYYLGIGYSSAGGKWTSEELACNETHLIVVKIRPNTSKGTNDEYAELFLDPDLTKSEEENVSARIDTVVGSGIGSIRGIDIIQRKNVTGKVAGLRFGDSWESVALAMPETERRSVVTNFSDESIWGVAPSTSYNNNAENPNPFPTSDVDFDGIELVKAGVVSKTIQATTGEYFTVRLEMDKKSNGGMMELPYVESAARVDIYASVGGSAHTFSLEMYNNSKLRWETVESYDIAETNKCFIFRSNLNRAEPTKLRIVNTDGSAKFIWKIVTYPSMPTDLAVPAAQPATNVSSKAFSANWSAVAGATGYRVIVYNADRDSIILRKEVEAGVTTLPINSKLSPLSNYYYKVSAIGDGVTTVDSYLSEAVNVTTTADAATAEYYTRSVTAGNYGTICLPKACEDLSSSGGVFFAVVGKLLEAGKVKQVVFEEVTELEAGKPYVFLATESEINVPMIGDAVLEAGSENGLVGSFVVSKVSKLVYNYVLSNNMLYCAKNAQYYVGENRAYFNINVMSEVGGVAPAPGRRRVAMNVEESETATYIEETLLGDGVRKVIEDGQLLIEKDGKYYDVLGRGIVK